MHEFESGFYRVEFPTDVPWHRLGVFIDPKTHGEIRSQEALTLAGLDWEVAVQPNYLPGPMQEVRLRNAVSGEWETTQVTLQGRQVPEDYSVVRMTDGSILGRSVGGSYRPLQNKLAFEIMDLLVTDGHLHYECAGSLRGGELVWILARVKGEPYKVKGIDEIYEYVLGTNAHNGQRAFRLLGTSIRVVCANTLALALHKGGDQGIAVQHSGDVEYKAKEAVKALVELHDSFKTFTRQAEILAQHELTDKDVVNFVNALYPNRSDDEDTISRALRNKRDELFDEYAQGDGVNTVNQISGTAWDMFNAVTRITNHRNKPRLSSSIPEAQRTEQVYTAARMESTMFGNGNVLNQNALEWLLALSTGRDPSTLRLLDA